MKVLFLDVDGVLNCADYFNTRMTPRDLRPRDMDPARVLLLHRILEETGAKVVVSSSWRLNADSLDEVRAAVEPHYFDKTPRHARFQDRHAEIDAWLKEHAVFAEAVDEDPIERYAILDDDHVAGIGHGENFFKTEWHGEGLNENIATAVIAHLNHGE